MKSICACIREHYLSTWAVAPVAKKWDKGPTWTLPSDLSILEFPPSGKRDMWTYATCCMCDLDDDHALELHLFSPMQYEPHVELLTVVAHYNHTGAHLGLGHTVNFGRPWMDGSLCDHGLISLPYLDGPSLEICDCRPGAKPIRCCWLIPITKEECEFAKSHGIEALEQKFEASGANYVDPMRTSTV